MAKSPQKSRGTEGKVHGSREEMRVQTVYTALANALTNEEIIQFAAENWDVGRPSN